MSEENKAIARKAVVNSREHELWIPEKPSPCDGPAPPVLQNSPGCGRASETKAGWSTQARIAASS
jgi:hypothetical protein